MGSNNGLLVPLNDEASQSNPLQRGLDAYWAAVDRREAKKEKEDDRKMQMKMHGLIQTPEGGYEYDDLTRAAKQADIDSKKGLLQRQLDLDQAGFTDKGLIKNENGFGLAPEEQEKRETDISYKKALRDRALRAKEFAPQKQRSSGSPNADKSIKAVPFEAQVEIKKLATDSATKRAITNNMKGALKVLKDPNLSEEQKLTHANSLIKMLNSAQGQDAVGEGEAKRLAGLLNYNIAPNLTNPGPMFGRAPISDFAKQIENKVTELDGAVKLNEETINSLYGNEPAQGLLKQSSAPASEEDIQAIEWAKANPNDPRSTQILQLHGVQ